MCAPAVRGRAIPTGVRGEPPSGDPTARASLPAACLVCGACLPLALTHTHTAAAGGGRERKKRERKKERRKKKEIEERKKTERWKDWKRKEKDPRKKENPNNCLFITADIIHTVNTQRSLV